MNFKLNIIEPWKYGTEYAIDAVIVKENDLAFLLFVHEPRKIKEATAHYFVCEFYNSDDKIAFKNGQKGNYRIHMVFDKNIRSEKDAIPLIGTYRGNFLSGELVINNR